MNPGSPLPTFFIIGAPKAGTTSLHHYMNAHPGIAMTRGKDPHVMTGPRERDRVSAYARLFPPDAEIRGECSVGYAAHPVDPDPPRNIAALTPDARLIYLVRDPVERAIAHYAQHLTTGADDRPPDQALATDDPGCLYLAASRYATQVETYLKGGDLGRMLVIESTELRDRRRETMRRAFVHVGADPEYWGPTLEATYNVRARDNVRLGRIGNRIKRSRLSRASRSVLPHRFHARAAIAARRALGTEVRPTVSAELRARLATALGPEADRLRELTGQAFADWSV
jgi:hypothetical protein